MERKLWWCGVYIKTQGHVALILYHSISTPPWKWERFSEREATPRRLPESSPFISSHILSLVGSSVLASPSPTSLSSLLYFPSLNKFFGTEYHFIFEKIYLCACVCICICGYQWRLEEVLEPLELELQEVLRNQTWVLWKNWWTASLAPEHLLYMRHHDGGGVREERRRMEWKWRVYSHEAIPTANQDLELLNYFSRLRYKFCIV